MSRYRQTIEEAIAHKRVLLIRYEGWSAERAIEPHAYGIDSEGKELLREWQEFGASESGERTGWKLFSISKILSMQPTQSVFSGARPGYKRGDTAMQRIYAQL